MGGPGGPGGRCMGGKFGGGPPGLGKAPGCPGIPGGGIYTSIYCKAQYQTVAVPNRCTYAALLHALAAVTCNLCHVPSTAEGPMQCL